MKHISISWTELHTMEGSIALTDEEYAALLEQHPDEQELGDALVELCCEDAANYCTDSSEYESGSASVTIED